ncbi:ComEC/Rec2 family competence protein [Dysgonomonas capnocytophagoides]|uniref:ComEC/Rec2 family competence protein n=1 Tax=Dysgonomonas capnocytophagoides TaxID=45254 RepID=UPI0029262ED4|nr:hypothetical protein DCPSUM001_29360 [Dysgonomonas capnocytophagoides]
MKFKLLQANNGDAIHLRIKDGEGIFHNVLIDGGTPETYSYKNKKGKAEDGELKQLIEHIKNQNEFIDLLILTHVDDDHIGGILNWFEQDENAKDLVKKVWFNSGRLIFEYFQQVEIEENLLKIKNTSSSNTTIAQGVIFEDFIEQNKIWDRRIIKSGDEFNIFGLKFTILSPSNDKLRSLLCKWEKECPISETSRTSDYSLSLSDLINTDSFKEDDSIHNGSSIAFIVEKQNKNILFLGDAHPQTIVDSLVSLGYSSENPLKVDFVKISHHGSKANTNVELLELIQTNNFLISSNGSRHKLPDKRCLARIIKNKKQVNLYFNYPELALNIFTKQEFSDFSNFSIVGDLEYIKI